MNIQHAMIVAKSIFPNAHIQTNTNGDVYLMDGKGYILVVLNEKSNPERANTIWCYSNINNPKKSKWDKCWMPVEQVTEKEWIKELNLWKNTR